MSFTDFDFSVDILGEETEPDMDMDKGTPAVPDPHPEELGGRTTAAEIGTGTEHNHTPSKPSLDVKSTTFTQTCEEHLPGKYGGLEDFMLNGNATDLKEFLDCMANSQEVAEALHRLRIIMGITPYDSKTKYELHYIMSDCTLNGLTDDTENYIAPTMAGLVQELFLDSFYLLECDVEVDIVALPSNLTPFEQDWITCHPVGGVRMRPSHGKGSEESPGEESPGGPPGGSPTTSGILQRFQAYLTGDRLPVEEDQDYDPDEEDNCRLKQWELMRDWVFRCPEIKNFPCFSSTEYQFEAMAKEEFQKAFLGVLQTIESQFGPVLDCRIQSERVILSGHRLVSVK